MNADVSAKTRLAAGSSVLREGHVWNFCRRLPATLRHICRRRSFFARFGRKHYIFIVCVAPSRDSSIDTNGYGPSLRKPLRTLQMFFRKPPWNAKQKLFLDFRKAIVFRDLNVQSSRSHSGIETVFIFLILVTKRFEI